MPGLYSITANTGRVAVSNTTGLYIGSGSVAILNNAQQLLNTLSNSSSVIFSLDPATSNTTVTAVAINGNYSNVNVAAYLPTYSGSIGALTLPSITSSYLVSGLYRSSLAYDGGGNMNIHTYASAGRNATANFYSDVHIFDDGSGTTNFTVAGPSSLQGVTATTVSASTISTSGSISASSSISASGNITSSSSINALSGNVTAVYFKGNGSLLSGLPVQYSNSNVASYLPIYGGNILLGNASITNNATVSKNVTVTGNVTSGNVSSGNVTAAYFITSGTGGNISGANYITANFFVGNGALLTGITSSGGNYSNVNVAAYLPTYTGLLGGTLSTATQPNITSVGTLSSLTVSGNVTSSYFIGNGSLLTGITAGTNYSNSNVASYLPVYGGNILASNITASGRMVVSDIGSASVVALNTGDVTTKFLVEQVGTTDFGTATYIRHSTTQEPVIYTARNNSNDGNVAGNVTNSMNLMSIRGLGVIGSNAKEFARIAIAANTTGTLSDTSSPGRIVFYTTPDGSTTPRVSALVSASGNMVMFYDALVSGNVSANNISANNGISGTLSTAAQPNITSVGTLTSLTSTGNITAGNLITSGVSGNISGVNYVSANYFVGDGSFLTNVAGAGNYGNANVAAYLPTYTGNLSAGNLSLTGIVSSALKVADVQYTSLPINGVGDTTSKFGVNQVGTTDLGTASFYRHSTTLEPFFVAGRNNSNDPAVLGNVTTNMNLFTLGAYGMIGTNNKAFSQIIFASNTTGNINGSSSPGRITFLTTPDGSTTPRSVMRINAAGFVAMSYDAQISGNLTVGNISANNAVSAASFSGNGAGLTSITGAQVTGTVANAAYATNAGSANFATSATFVTGLTSANVTTALGYTPADANAASNYGNANVAAYLPTYTGALTSLTGAVTTTANVTGAYIIGNGSALTAISGAAVTGTVANASYATNAGSANFATTATGATYVTGLTSANVTTALGYVPLNSNASPASANVATYANLAYIEGTSSNGNYVPLMGTVNNTYGTLYAENGGGFTYNPSTNLLTVGNVTIAGTLINSGSALTAITGANVTGTVANASYATNAGSANFATNATTTTNANLTRIEGTSISATYVPAMVSAAGINTYGTIYAEDGGGFTYNPGTNLLSVGAVTASGNVTGAYIIGNGSQLTNLPTQPGTYTNSNVAAYLPTYTGNLVSLTGAVITTANVQANYFIGNGSQLTGISTTPAAGTVFNPFLLAGM